MYRKKNRELQSQIQFISLEDLVPKDHILRAIDRAIDFSFIYDEVEGLYSSYEAGRPGIDPVSLFKIVFIQYLFGIRSMRQTIKEINVNVAYRWFIGYGLTEPIPHFSTFGKNYVRRFKDTDIFEHIETRKSRESRFFRVDIAYYAAGLWGADYSASSSMRVSPRMARTMSSTKYMESVLKDLRLSSESFAAMRSRFSSRPLRF